jgi:hypothetical protein
MSDPFRNHALGPTCPALGASAIVPSDGQDLSTPIRALTIGSVAGTVSFVGRDGLVHTTGVLPLGTYPLFAQRIRQTGTTAAGLTGWQ